jgi:hypothetical protein
MDLKTLKNTALIGHTGFVGSNLLQQNSFDHTYNSKNFKESEGSNFGLVVCAGISAVKWLANRYSENDRAEIEMLKLTLQKVTADYFVLISTIDVYNNPRSVTENDEPSMTNHHAYGTHRYEFEHFVTSRFKNTLVLRLPSLFGPGLKKNAIFDLLTNSNIDQINPAGKFQWYPVVRLWDDIKKAAAADLHLLNISTEPITTSAIAKNFFPKLSLTTTSGEPSSYDVWSIHAEKFDKDGHYLLGRADVMQALSDYLAVNEHASKAY